MVRHALVLTFGLFLSDTAFGDQDDWVYIPRQQSQQRQYQQQPEQRQFYGRDDYRNDYNQDHDYQNYQGNQNYNGYHGGYRGYNPQPPTGYQAPADYYGLPPVRGFVYPQQQPQQIPRFDNYHRRH
ncbi:hypothetical protein [Methylomonas albis]|uniref:Uncharacterized protein n=1 Tax=Methylomonas albis TaxID=1854563 RepID=A0ABR9D4R8_9GAMM|nr:hypothetical protein [Methylomonas albis]MBD9358126.1 hypothetical protein [Methylomonas albis]CAD6881493.1 hypothetical protein [Methylomonas albis]